MSVSDRVDTWLVEREQEDHMSALFPFLLFSLLVCHSFCSPVTIDFYTIMLLIKKNQTNHKVVELGVSAGSCQLLSARDSCSLLKPVLAPPFTRISGSVSLVNY